MRTRKTQDNTVGSRSKHLAYIAGFLDGDGSLMLQIKKRNDGALKRRFMPTICFYQDTRHEKPLSWVREVLGIGYLSRRNDGMTELRINGYAQVRDILKALLPYIRFKKLQAIVLCDACEILSNAKRRRLTDKQLITLANLILVIQEENYVTKKKRSKSELLEMLGLTP
ncbi:MAG: hypothetical protein A3C70_03375 [Candidatus Zambryskibacteria bacterium RIFCSPHIGHO2_02_FULL_43_14]|uniref:Homing endonuclease LAGLIDADG domain-containing protein n=1 Tax=Candidatus Zambryskibacteria bacterium RIFCSPHIGHO2_02_FULL_43_14 TaxID=1802748 RepID=A0A1G2TG58_9BACT|nr:MAG: hypothetical protein A2829_02600 [Candidatus Zambryskibacteria bacterium RIFCSPHIGHO2_01_FULL_43_60]OHA96284.1 MAG: hypothetical protein A3C70_03375 [Candidatus Zambryskibacteria bacterium RIFCSPHIGHO2_02_FULL_43_14]OHB04158.1 MAG: hypothetical protein A3B03_00055 [Candidatus Zambryskibacteria bacterium RIFCSPLOWO2_01_FULL_42_41]